MNHSYCFIVNCASNSKKAEFEFRKHEHQIKSALGSADFLYITAYQSIKEQARDAANKYSHIIACGGDGTANKVAQGLLGTEAIFGVLPLGSGNDFAKNVGMTKSFSKNLEIIQQNKQAKLDILQTDDVIVINTFGLGLDGLTNYYASKVNTKNGALRYFWGGIKALITSSRFKAIITFYDGENEDQIRIKTWMIVVANGKTEGGKYKISPDSDISDGVIELIVVKPINRIIILFEFIKLSLGLPLNEQVVQKYKVKREIRIEIYKEIKAHADGEQVIQKQQYNFELKQQAIPVVVGR